MTAGTRAFLAGIAIFVGILVTYYGVFTPPEGDVVTADPVATPVQEEKTKEKAKAEKPRRRDVKVPPSRPATPRTAGRSTPARSTPSLPPARRHASLDRTDPDQAPTGTGGGTDADLGTDTPADSGADTPTRTVKGAESPRRPEPRATAAPPLEPPAPAVPRSTPADRSAPQAGPTPGKPPAPTPDRRAARASGPPPTTRYTIRPGDTFSSIADAHLSDARKWQLIAKANPLVDPKALQVGQVIKLPSRAAASKPERRSATVRDRERAAQPGRRHAVKEGETLSDIAEIYYDDANRWLVIYEANRPEIGTDPDRLRLGMVLIIPRSP